MARFLEIPTLLPTIVTAPAPVASWLFAGEKERRRGKWTSRVRAWERESWGKAAEENGAVETTTPTQNVAAALGRPLASLLVMVDKENQFELSQPVAATRARVLTPFVWDIPRFAPTIVTLLDPVAAKGQLHGDIGRKRELALASNENGPEQEDTMADETVAITRENCCPGTWPPELLRLRLDMDAQAETAAAEPATRHFDEVPENVAEPSCVPAIPTTVTLAAPVPRGAFETDVAATEPDFRSKVSKLRPLESDPGSSDSPAVSTTLFLGPMGNARGLLQLTRLSESQENPSPVDTPNFMTDEKSVGTCVRPRLSPTTVTLVAPEPTAGTFAGRMLQMLNFVSKLMELDKVAPVVKSNVTNTAAPATSLGRPAPPTLALTADCDLQTVAVAVVSPNRQDPLRPLTTWARPSPPVPTMVTLAEPVPRPTLAGRAAVGAWQPVSTLTARDSVPPTVSETLREVSAIANRPGIPADTGDFTARVEIDSHKVSQLPVPENRNVLADWAFKMDPPIETPATVTLHAADPG